jgi:hypothetical protein
VQTILIATNTKLANPNFLPSKRERDWDPPQPGAIRKVTALHVPLHPNPFSPLTYDWNPETEEEEDEGDPDNETEPEAFAVAAPTSTPDLEEDWEDWKIYQTGTIDDVFTVTGSTISPPSPLDGLTFHEGAPTKPSPHHSGSSSADYFLRHVGSASAPQPDPAMQSSSIEDPTQPTAHTRQQMRFPPHPGSKPRTSPISLEAREARVHEPTWCRNPIAGEHSDDYNSDDDLDPESQAVLAHFQRTGRLLPNSDRPMPPPGMESLSIDEIDDLIWSHRPSKTQRARRNKRLRKQQRDRDLEAIAKAYRDDHDDHPPPLLPSGPQSPPPGSLTRALRRPTTYERPPSPDTPRVPM